MTLSDEALAYFRSQGKKAEGLDTPDGAIILLSGSTMSEEEHREAILLAHKHYASKVVGPALRLSTGQVYSLPAPARHGHVYVVALRENTAWRKTSKDTDGFMTDLSCFLTRDEALRLVRHTGQLSEPLLGGRTLTSEDLW